MRKAADWLDVLVRCGVKPATAARWADAFEAEVRPEKFSLGADEVDDFLAQVLHESGMLERMEEGLSYSTPANIRRVWPSRFPTDEAAQPFVRNPQALANKVYGGRLGNTGSNDGWLYRGSGPIQVTGKANFQALERATGLPLVTNPDLLRRPGTEALRVCIAWWESNVPDSVMGDVKKVRRAVNGGQIGLEDTERLARLTDLADGKADGRLAC